MITLFDLSGINSLFATNIENIDGLAQAWFLWPLCLSYILMLILKRNKNVEEYIDNNLKQVTVISILLQVALAYCGVQISYFIQFFLGYYFAKNNRTDECDFGKLSVLTFVICILRILANRYIDGTILYDKIIARLSMNILAIWLFIFEYKLCDETVKLKNFITTKTFQLLDKLSYALYLVHYMFLYGCLSVKYISNNTIIQLLFFCLFTIVGARFVSILSERFNKLIATD